jgi:hypothetical protein
MDLEQFIRLIQSSHLWFSQVHQLEDLLEGSAGRLNSERRGQRQQGFSVPFYTGGPFVGEDSRFFYVNCWHLSEHESMGMWKIYASRGLGIALKTSVANLKMGILDSKAIYGGVVSYVNHSEDPIPENPYERLLRKDLSYSYEQEFRMIHRIANWDELEEKPSGIEVEINPEVLISEIIVAPDTEPWRIEIVEKLIASAKYSFKVSKSRINYPTSWSRKSKS